MNTLTNLLSRLCLVFSLMILWPAVGLQAQTGPDLDLKVPVKREAMPAGQGKVTVHLRNLLVGHTYHLYLTTANCDALTGKTLLWTNAVGQGMDCFEAFTALSNEADLSWTNTTGSSVLLSVVPKGEVAAKPVVRTDSLFGVTNQFDLDSLLASLFIADGGVKVSNVQTIGSDSCRAFFSNGDNAVGLQSGLLLSTGVTFQATGPNDQMVASTSMGRPGDVNIGKILFGQFNVDAAGVVFDFIPSSNHISFQFVFASEEYPENVCTNFQDAIGLFITGPSSTWPYNYNARNMALIPDTNIIVNVNSINPGMVGNPMVDPEDCLTLDYSSLYVDNLAGQQLRFDGFTVPLQTGIEVIPYQKYTLKIVIADAGDGILDSGFFIAGGNVQAFIELDTIDFGPYLICEDDVYTFEGQGYAPGEYFIPVLDQNGLDSLIIRLTVWGDEHVEYDLGVIHLCQEDTVSIGGYNWTVWDEGYQEITIPKMNYPYCDSTILFEITPVTLPVQLSHDGPLTLTDTLVTISAQFDTSVVSLMWTDSDGNFLDNDSILVVSEPGLYCLVVTNADGCTAMACTEIEYDAGTAINSVGVLEEIGSMWPQPANQEVHLRLNTLVMQQGVQIIVRDIAGRQVYLWYGMAAETIIPVGEWPSGMYTIQAMTGHNNKTVIGKLLVQH
ncbi:MAG: T9SS type A sorting domain-containing protein [Lewinellaceae bacterium]|nr:T9SS type A sorting domain-containing protein [Saprospiraceae bacterium]MCB9313278.1 T9SS type A sorting domain-containing protein [Lewinellaceae bacterium]HRW75907.1 choice-of-anchor L domain-containing protein [Saprospiraceae bacterium]